MSLKHTPYNTIAHPYVGIILEDSTGNHHSKKLTDWGVCDDIHPQTVKNINDLVIQLARTIEKQQMELQKKDDKISELETIISDISDPYKSHIGNTIYDSSEFEETTNMSEEQNYTYTETVQVQVPNEHYDDSNYDESDENDENDEKNENDESDENKFIKYEELIQVYDPSEKLEYV